MDDLCKRCKINKAEVKYSKAGEKYCKLCDYYIHNIMNKCIVCYNNFTDEKWGAVVGCKFSRFAQLIVGIHLQHSPVP